METLNIHLEILSDTELTQLALQLGLSYQTISALRKRRGWDTFRNRLIRYWLLQKHDVAELRENDKWTALLRSLRNLKQERIAHTILVDLQITGRYICTYRIALKFRGSLISRISRIQKHSRKYFNEILSPHACRPQRTCACFDVFENSQKYFNDFLKNSNSRKFRPTKFKHYTVCIILIHKYTHPYMLYSYNNYYSVMTNKSHPVVGVSTYFHARILHMKYK